MTKSDYSACVLLSMPLRVKSSIRVFIFAACILTGTLNVIGWGSTPIRYLYVQEGDVTISTPSLLWQPTRKQQQHRQQGKTTTLSIPKIAVFYNLYIPNRTDVERVSRIVDEQFRFLRSHHSPIYVHSIGVPHPLHNDSNRTILLGHHDKGSEVLSLQSLWEHCKRFPQSKVVYLHSKVRVHFESSVPGLPPLSNSIIRSVSQQQSPSLCVFLSILNKRTNDVGIIHKFKGKRNAAPVHHERCNE
jgi:hypothetical protein